MQECGINRSELSMKKIIMFMQAGCPYCIRAKAIQQQLLNEAAYAGIHIEMIDENLHPEIADLYDYFFVPSYYYNGRKLHEGAAEQGDLRRIFESVAAN